MPAEIAATIVLPTHDHGPTIRYAVASVLSQTVENIELFIIGDGVLAGSRQLLEDLAAEDERVRFLDFPKHGRRGEPNRHQALQEARGEIVCYICDRDLWLPDHIARMQGLLADADFAHSLSLHILPGDEYKFHPINLAHPGDRETMLIEANAVAFSCAAHTLDMYRRLPHGWRTTPGKVFTDWYMFRQFLEQPGCRAVSGNYPSAVTFPSPPRLAANWSQDDRLEELERWSARLADQKGRENFVVDVLLHAAQWQNRVVSETKAVLQLLNTTRLAQISESSIGQYFQKRSRKLFDLQKDHGRVKVKAGSAQLKDTSRGRLQFAVTNNYPAMVLPSLDSTHSEFCLLSLSVECPYETNMRLAYREQNKGGYSPSLSLTVPLSEGENTVHVRLHRRVLKNGLFYEMASIMEGLVTINHFKIHALK